MQEAKTGNGGPEGPDGGLGAWVAAHAPRYHEEARACARLAAAANRGDTARLRELLAEDCTHTTQSTFTEYRGSEELAWKLTSGHGEAPRRHHFELATCPPDGRPGVLVHQRDEEGLLPGLGERAVTLVFEVDPGGRVRSSFGQTVVPHPDTVRASGLFPGLGAEALERERARPGLSLGGAAPVALHLFVLAPGEEARAQEAWVRSVLRGLDLPPLRVTVAGEASWEEGQLMARAGVHRFPTLTLEHERGLVELPVHEAREVLAARVRSLLGAGADGGEA